jgi:hypothetical protein
MQKGREFMNKGAKVKVQGNYNALGFEFELTTTKTEFEARETIEITWKLSFASGLIVRLLTWCFVVTFQGQM